MRRVHRGKKIVHANSPNSANRTRNPGKRTNPQKDRAKNYVKTNVFLGKRPGIADNLVRMSERYVYRELCDRTREREGEGKREREAIEPWSESWQLINVRLNRALIKDFVSLGREFQLVFFVFRAMLSPMLRYSHHGQCGFSFAWPGADKSRIRVTGRK